MYRVSRSSEKRPESCLRIASVAPRTAVAAVGDFVATDVEYGYDTGHTYWALLAPPVYREPSEYASPVLLMMSHPVPRAPGSGSIARCAMRPCRPTAGGAEDGEHVALLPAHRLSTDSIVIVLKVVHRSRLFARERSTEHDPN